MKNKTYDILDNDIVISSFSSNCDLKDMSIVVKKPEVIKTKWYMDDAGFIYPNIKTVEGEVEVKPVNDEMTEWCRV